MKKKNVGILNQKMESSKANAYLKEQTISKCHRKLTKKSVLYVEANIDFLNLVAIFILSNSVGIYCHCLFSLNIKIPLT